MSRTVSNLLDEGLERGFFAGAAAVVSAPERIVLELTAGSARLDPLSERTDAVQETLWDLASLTKPLAGAALVLALAAEKALALDDPIQRFGDAFKKTRFEDVTLRSLLIHTAGQQAWFPCYVRGEGRGAYRRTLASLDADGPPGRKVVYSCLGYLLLSDVVEQAASQSLDVLFRDRIAAPLGLATELLFAPDGPPLAAAAGGERDDRTERRMVAERGLRYQGFRSGVVNGVVNDGNAYRRAGGVSLNAGLFGTARAVARMARAWLDRDPALLPEGLLVEATRSHTAGLEEERGLGWQIASTDGSPGAPLGADAYGHTGFTGASLFCQPDGGRAYVLLTNRLHPDARSGDMNAFRRRFHEAARTL